MCCDNSKKSHHKEKMAKIERFTQHSPNNNNDILLYWYLLQGPGNHYYYYSSPTPVTDFSNVTFTETVGLPAVLQPIEGDLTAERAEFVSLDGLPASVTESTDGIDEQEVEVGLDGLPINPDFQTEQPNEQPVNDNPANTDQPDNSSTDPGASDPAPSSDPN